MSGPTRVEDPELRGEQEHLDLAHRSLSAMRERAEALFHDLRTAGQLDLDYKAALSRRVAVLRDSSRPLLFGRIDDEAGFSWHIGRRHVEDDLGDPVVINWRAPVAMPFYRARVEESLGLKRRRQVMVDRRQVIAVADDLFGDGHDDRSGTRLRGGEALLAELERARTGEMLDIVATIQAEQDEIIRAPIGELLTVQGGPGTGKTAVGLHRAAFLLYNHPSLSRDGVLVLGPSRAFLRYVAQVLPSLGEEAVVQSTVADLAPRLKVRAEDSVEVRRLKGDPRMALLLASALRARRHLVEGDVMLRARFAHCSLSAEEINTLSSSLAANPAPYRAGRLALGSRLVGLVRQKLRAAGRVEAEATWLDRELPASDQFKTLLNQVWPSVSPKALISELLTDVDQLELCARGILTEAEWRSLARTKGKTMATQAWTADDLPLLDEAEHLINGQLRTYGHVVVDEAQDLSPMEFRMVARRAPSGALTVLGDLAQATGVWSYSNWEEIRRHLPTVATVRHDELTQGYHTSGQVLELASKLLALAAPTIRPTRSIRQGRREPRLLNVGHGALLAAALGEADKLAKEGFLVGLVVTTEHAPAMTALVGERTDVGLLERDGMNRQITVVDASAAKGLEFDAVVVVEPSAIAGTEARGLRLLYVALTRPIHHLSIVHAEALPAPLVT